MSDKELRQDVKIAKAKGLIKNYYELSEILQMSVKSIYNWLGGYYSMSYKKRQILANYLKQLES